LSNILSRLGVGSKRKCSASCQLASLREMKAWNQLQLVRDHPTTFVDYGFRLYNFVVSLTRFSSGRASSSQT